MKIHLYKIIGLIFLTIITAFQTKAQPKIGKAIKASIGYGISVPYDYEDIIGTGFYAQAEYVIGISKWFGIKPYAGLILTSENKDNKSNPFGYKVTSNAFLLGGKARICAPIPYVAPYIEVGIGLSAGSFETYTAKTNDIQKKGILPHIPFSIGLALGKKHNVDVEFTYYYHPAVEQFSGAMALGFSIPLDK
ncbi:hypothetical protein [Flavobacterium sp.]|uniref:hypothetical protein n=1 Tax=Flavobacterium sp. TaxID=239 RepID=UPI003C55C3F9